jgi:hypothetical protein
VLGPKVSFEKSLEEKLFGVNPPFYPTIILLSFSQINLAFYHLHAYIA